MSTITKPLMLDETGQAIVEALNGLTGVKGAERVTTLDTTPITSQAIEALGVPVYVNDVSAYAGFGLTETGWYVFARIRAPKGVYVTETTAVTGAAAVMITGNEYLDVAVLFEVAAVSKTVTVDWGSESEDFVFKATDLAIRNLDYRTTFYVYDAAPYVTWEYSQVTSGTFAEGTNYYTLVDGEYVKTEVTAGEAVVKIYYEDAYILTEDTTFVADKTYYTLVDGVYTAAEVTAGEAVPEGTYYVHGYAQTTDEAFEAGKTYYTLAEGVYTAAEVTAGEAINTAYYTHSKCIISGMVRNVTYRLDEIIDCPMEFILPEIEDETHGCWFEIRCRHAGEYSMTLTPPSSDVKIATEHTQKETAGINMINLHYTVIDDIKLWRFLNTHSNIPTDSAPTDSAT